MRGDRPAHRRKSRFCRTKRPAKTPKTKRRQRKERLPRPPVRACRGQTQPPRRGRFRPRRGRIPPPCPGHGAKTADWRTPPVPFRAHFNAIVSPSSASGHYSADAPDGDTMASRRADPDVATDAGHHAADGIKPREKRHPAKNRRTRMRFKVPKIFDAMNPSRQIARFPSQFRFSKIKPGTTPPPAGAPRRRRRGRQKPPSGASSSGRPSLWHSPSPILSLHHHPSCHSAILSFPPSLSGNPSPHPVKSPRRLPDGLCGFGHNAKREERCTQAPQVPAGKPTAL